MNISAAAIGVSVLAILLTTSVHAETKTPKPLEGGSVSIGVVHGSGYYTVEKDGYRVVITLTKGVDRPIRFETVLADKQAMMLSAPREDGQKPQTIKVRRSGEELIVEKDLQDK